MCFSSFRARSLLRVLDTPCQASYGHTNPDPHLASRCGAVRRSGQRSGASLRAARAGVCLLGHSFSQVWCVPVLCNCSRGASRMQVHFAWAAGPLGVSSAVVVVPASEHETVGQVLARAEARLPMEPPSALDPPVGDRCRRRRRSSSSSSSGGGDDTDGRSQHSSRECSNDVCAAPPPLDRASDAKIESSGPLALRAESASPGSGAVLIGRKRCMTPIATPDDDAGPPPALEPILPLLHVPQCGLLSLWCRNGQRFWISLIDSDSRVWLPFRIVDSSVQLDVPDLPTHVQPLPLTDESTFETTLQAFVIRFHFPNRLNQFYVELDPAVPLVSVLFSQPPTVSLLRQPSLERTSKLVRAWMSGIAHSTALRMVAAGDSVQPQSKRVKPHLVFADEAEARNIALSPRSGQDELDAPGSGGESASDSDDDPMGWPCLYNLVGTFNAYCAVFAADGTRIVAGSGDGSISVWDVREGHRPRLVTRRELPYGRVNKCGVAPDGRYVAVSTRNGIVALLDMVSYEVARTLEVEGEVFVSLFAHDSAALYVGTSTGRVYQFRTADWSCLGSTVLYPSAIFTLAQSPDMRTLYVVGSAALLCVCRLDGEGRPWGPPLPVAVHNGFAYTVCLLAGGRFLGTGGADRLARVWCARCLSCVQQASIGTLGFFAAAAPNSRALLVAGERECIAMPLSTALWQQHGPGLCPERVPPVESAPATGANAAAAAAAAASDRSDAAQGFLMPSALPPVPPVDGPEAPPLVPEHSLEVVARHAGEVYAIAVAPGGRILCTGSQDFTLPLRAIPEAYWLPVVEAGACPSAADEAELPYDARVAWRAAFRTLLGSLQPRRMQ